ncbi:helix-turn-helix domain-containing protein [Micromonospora sp. NPDC050686]|uniref:helix-turn-helix domain-containing protein n=1 Tax=Micromonospora sp. NPDC050686 TaxID=3154631 RepID=UPI0033C66A6B
MDDGADEVQPRSGSAPDPFAATSPVEFVAAMRALKEWSGLTFRELQRQADKFGEALPHSTIAAVLARSSLPREALVTAFVRACGLDEATAASWLATRKRLAVQSARAAAPGGGGGPDPITDSQPPSPPEPVTDTSVGWNAPDETGRSPAPQADAERLPVLASVLRSVPLSDPESSSPAPDDGALRPAPQHQPAATEGPTGPGPGIQEPDLPSSASRLASVTAERTDERWVGMHRHDPAEDVPRPAGHRWLIPPIMYRTGWASRVLSGVLVLVMAAIAVAVVARALRDSPASTAGSDGRAELPLDELDRETLPAAVPSSVPSPTRSPSTSRSPSAPRSASGSAAPQPKPSGSPSTKPATGRSVPAGPAGGPVTGPVRLRVAHTGMCVGDGPELYKSSGRTVLGQHSCASASPPIVLEQVSGTVYRIKLAHPQYGIGCATIDANGRVDGLLLAGDVCGSGRSDQTFTFEPLTGAGGGYRVRSVPGKAYCIGVYEERRDVGTQLIQTSCSSALAQTFIVDRR